MIGFTLACRDRRRWSSLTAETALPIVMTPELMLGLFVLTVVMCVVSAIAAIMQVMRIDPAMVFAR